MKGFLEFLKNWRANSSSKTLLVSILALLVIAIIPLLLIVLVVNTVKNEAAYMVLSFLLFLLIPSGYIMFTKYMN
jgi:hypothetical protein